MGNVTVYMNIISCVWTSNGPEAHCKIYQRVKTRRVAPWTRMFTFLDFLMVVCLQRSLICSPTQVHHQCLSTKATGASAVQIKGSRRPCRDDVFELPCLWSDTCMERDKGQRKRGRARRFDRMNGALFLDVNSSAHLLHNPSLNGREK